MLGVAWWPGSVRPVGTIVHFPETPSWIQRRQRHERHSKGGEENRIIVDGRWGKKKNKTDEFATLCTIEGVHAYMVGRGGDILHDCLGINVFK